MAINVEARPTATGGDIGKQICAAREALAAAVDTGDERLIRVALAALDRLHRVRLEGGRRHGF